MMGTVGSKLTLWLSTEVDEDLVYNFVCATSSSERLNGSKVTMLLSFCRFFRGIIEGSAGRTAALVTEMGVVIDNVNLSLLQGL